MNMVSNEGSLSDFIDACLEQKLSKEELVDFYKKSIQNAVARTLEEEDDPCAQVVPANLDQGLHIASIFIILVASSLGVAFPLLAKYHKKLNIHHYWVIFGKCAGTGVLLSCALVHMILPSNESLTSGCVPTVFNTDYTALAYVFALIAILSMHALEFFLLSVLSPVTADICDLGDTRQDEEAMQEDNLNADDCQQRRDKEKVQHLDSCPQSVGISGREKIIARNVSEAYMIEFGIAVHSVLIGLAVGVTDKDELVALLVALVFHQLFEGVALGSRLSDTNFGLWNEFILGGIFAVSAPTGIAIGIGTYKTLGTNGQAYLLAQGVFDGICGGILLYTGFTFLIEDFDRDMELHCRGKHQRLMQAGMFIALWVFAGLMSTIGKYL